MSISFCPMCGRKVEEDATTCPGCGCDFMNKPDDSVGQVNNGFGEMPQDDAFEPVQTDTAGFDSVNQSNDTADDVAVDNAVADSSPKKPKKIEPLLSVAIIVAIVTVIVAVIVFAVWNKRKNAETVETTRILVEEVTEAAYDSYVWESFSRVAGTLMQVDSSVFLPEQTSNEYVCEYTTVDEFAVYHYVINTAYEEIGADGKKTLHKVSARCFYVPECSKEVIITNLLVDGTALVSDNAKESWLMGQGSNPAVVTVTTTEATTVYAQYYYPAPRNTTKKETEPTENYDDYYDESYDDYTEEFYGDYTEEFYGDYTEEFYGDYTEETQEDYTEEIYDDVTEDYTEDYTEEIYVEGSYAEEDYYSDDF